MAALDGLVVKFYTNNVIPTRNAVLADFDVAALGNAGLALDNLSDPINLPGQRIGVHQEVSAIAGAAPTQETLYGAIILDSGGNLVAAEKFSEGVPIANEGDFISYDVIFALPAIWPTGVV